MSAIVCIFVEEAIFKGKVVRSIEMACDSFLAERNSKGNLIICRRNQWRGRIEK